MEGQALLPYSLESTYFDLDLIVLVKITNEELNMRQKKEVQIVNHNLFKVFDDFNNGVGF